MLINEDNKIYKSTNSIKMGICQHKPDNNLIYTTKSLMPMGRFSGINTATFYFSTEPLSKLDADCLLILSDRENIKGNRIIKGMYDRTAAKEIVKIGSENMQKSRKPEQGQLVFFNKSVQNLDFHKICVVYLFENDFQDHLSGIQKVIQSKIKENLQKIINQGVASIVITELEWKNWVNKIKIFKMVYLQIIKCSKLKSVVFSCCTEDSLNYFMKIVQQIKQIKQNQ